MLPHLIMPAHHDVRSSDVFARRLHGTLAAAAERGPADFPDLLLTPGVGARTVQSLAHGGRGRARRAVSLRRPGTLLAGPWRQGSPSLSGADQGLRRDHPRAEIGGAKAKLGRDEELAALKRLDDQARRLERSATGPSLEAFIAQERGTSPTLGGRSVFGWESDLVKAGKARSG